MKTKLLIGSLACLAALSLGAAPLTESTFTEIIHEVNTLSDDGSTTPSQVNQLLKAPQRVRTGPQSRAELTAPDHTITRVGANTVFSFADSGRTVNLEQGSLLFQAPKGIGGGTIKSGGASAAVLGTTLIVSATQHGGFKVILLEGKGKILLPNGKYAIVRAGQEVFVLADAKGFSKVFDVNLDKLVHGSQLVGGFSHELPSMQLILAAIRHQNALLASGGGIDTGIPPEFFIPLPFPGNGLGVLDPGSYQSAAHPPLTPAQISTLNFFQFSTFQPPPGSSRGGVGGRVNFPVTGPGG